MGKFIFIVIVIAVLSLIKAPSGGESTSSGELTEARKRELLRAARRARQRKKGGLPWFGNHKRNRNRMF